MHNHGVVDNNHPKPQQRAVLGVPSDRRLRHGLYRWVDMGEAASASRNLDDHNPDSITASFAGQGHYYPTRLRNGEMNKLNINGEHVLQKGYITDELTDYALDNQLIESQTSLFLYLSHKAVHANFSPAKRHANLYSDREIPIPLSQADTAENYRGKPMWVKNQRNSWHGVDFPYHSSLDVQAYKMEYHRAMSAVDDSIGRILSWLEANGLEKNTIVMLMGDNGFLFGEHGLIDKRTPAKSPCACLWWPGVRAYWSRVTLSMRWSQTRHCSNHARHCGIIARNLKVEVLDLARGRPVSNWRTNAL